MHGRMDRPLHDWHHVRHRFRCNSRQQLAAASNADSRHRLRGRHGLGAILHHATGIGARICRRKDVKSYAGKTSQFDESYGVWRRSLSVRIVGQLVATGICLTKRALGRWDSLPFSNIFQASSFSCSRTESTPAHLPVSRTVRVFKITAKTDSSQNPAIRLFGSVSV